MPNNLKIPPEFEAATSEQRIADNAANPAKAEPWDDVREALQNQLRSS